VASPYACVGHDVGVAYQELSPDECLAVCKSPVRPAPRQTYALSKRERKEGSHAGWSPDHQFHLARRSTFCMQFQYYDLETFDLLATEVIPAVEKIEVAGR
jgi:hypothetical protein